ncbi:MAG: tyrosine-type recombinase/integrase [Acidobacteria bacterium]|nr:tyrosine-type recombinase/integrase [Acidobacteriota bacterium]
MREFATGQPASLRIKARDLRKFACWYEGFGQPAGQWTPGVTQDYLNDLPVQPRTANRVRAHLKGFADWLMRFLRLGWHPLDGIKGSKVPLLEAKRLDPEEIARLHRVLREGFFETRKDLNRFKPGQAPLPEWARPFRDRAIVELLLGSGIRVGALVNLNVDHFKPELKMLSGVQEKGVQIRDIALSTRAVAAVQAYLNQERPTDAADWDSPALFLAQAKWARDRGDGRLTYNVIYRMVHKLGERAQIPNLNPHRFRHHLAFELLEAGGLPAVVAQLGHQNPSSSLAYLQMPVQNLLQTP